MKISLWISALVLGLAIGPSAYGACKIGQIAEIPVSIVGNTLLIDGQINGHDVKILVDTGAEFTSLWEDSATQLGLPLDTSMQMRVYGAGGEARVRGTMVEHFKMGTFSGEHLRLAVIGPTKHPSRNRVRHAAMVLGEDFLSHFTTEFDLAHGVICLLRPVGCAPDQLTYWSDTYSLAELERFNPEHARIYADVLVNGRRTATLLDTGAPWSIIARHEAEMAGVIPGKDGVVAADSITGVGGNALQSWIGNFDSFSLGDESMRNVKLRIADLFTADTVTETGSRVAHPVEGLASMILGCDFFLSHRILVSAKEHKLLFTYNDGPVFPFVEARATPTNASAHADNTPAPAVSTP